MKSLRGIAVLFVFLLLILGGPPARAGDEGAPENELFKKADADLGRAAQSLVEAMKGRIDAGDLGGVEELMTLLRQIMSIRAELESRIDRGEGGAAATEDPPGFGHWGEPPPMVGPADPDGQERTKWFSGRGGRRNLKSNGGSAATAGAVDLALAWLAKHQDPTGVWVPDGFGKCCTDGTCQGPGRPVHVAGITALAVLPFLGDGHTPYHGQYRETVGKGLAALILMQDPEGCIGARTVQHFTYGHALGAQALAEAWALSRAPRLEKPAQAAMDFIHKAQNPYLAWRYGVRPGDNDTSVTATMISALMAGRKAGLRVGPEVFDGAQAWIEKATEPEYGRVGYTSRGTGPARPQNVMDKFPSDKSESLTAAGILLRIYCGEHPRKSEVIAKGANLCLKALPVWDEAAGTIDFYYWYYGTQAMFQVGGEAWKTWNHAMKPALLDSQVKTGCAVGSWAPVGVWCEDGGRVYSTSISALILQTYYRHARLFESEFERRGFNRK